MTLHHLQPTSPAADRSPAASRQAWFHRVAPLSGLLLLLSSLYLLARAEGYFLLFHSLVELFAVLVACALFVIAWNARRIMDNGYLLLVGIGYLFVGGLDLLHMLAYEGMQVLPTAGPNLATCLWIAARYVETLTLLVAPLFLRRRLQTWRALILYGVATALLLVAVFQPSAVPGQWWHFPDCYVPGEGLTQFKILSEYLLVGLLGVALAGLLRCRGRFPGHVLYALVAAILLTMASELAFTKYVSVYGTSNAIGHLLKVASYSLLYQALVVTGIAEPYQLLFRSLKQSEQALRESEQRFRLAVEAAPHSMIIVDQQGRIVMVNAQAEACFGYDRQELLGQSVEMLVPQSFRAGHAAYRHDFMQHPVARPMGAGRDLYAVRRDGSVFPVEIGLSPVESEEGIRVMATILDITVRKRQEEQLRQLNQTLEQRVSQRTALAERRAAQLRAVAAELTQAEQRERRRLAQLLHDHLQQLLVAAKLSLAALEYAESPEEQQQGVERTEELIDDAIAASRSLTVELSPPILHDGGLAQALHWLARWDREKHGLEVHVAADSVDDPDAESISVVLFQAVRELLFNVVKHAQTREAWVRLSRHGERVQLEVRDRGVGFAPDQSAESGRSPGFGLFSVRERLELIDGSLEIESRPGQGTKILLDAPAIALQPAAVGGM